MARPTKNNIDSGIQGWDGKIDDNDEALFNAPIPIHEHTGDESDIQATFPAAAHDRCLVWIDHTTDLRSQSQGRATSTMEFDHYAKAPDHVVAEVRISDE